MGDGKIRLDSDIQFLKGVGPVRAAKLSRVGIKNVGDILFHFPFRYEDRSIVTPIESLSEGETFTINGEIVSTKTQKGRYGKSRFQLSVKDKTGIMSCLWFSVRGDWHSKKYKQGLTVLATGKVSFSNYQKCFEMTHPDISVLDDNGTDTASGGIKPVYPLTEGINQKVMRGIVLKAVEIAEKVKETLPAPILKRHSFPQRDAAVRFIHLPDEGDGTEKVNSFRSPAHLRMIYEEFFLMETAMAVQRSRNTEKIKGVNVKVRRDIIPEILLAFPFKLTSDQRNVLNEMAKDLEAEQPMNRLLQGDVGCGKTAVALIAMLLAVADRHQAAIMAPTEILAEQHYNTILKLKTSFPIKPALLVAGMRKKEKDKVLAKIASGEINLVAGTHALIQQGVEFKNLGVAIIDEQHRFGVKQRAELISKGEKPNTLIMTATPIPRTLAMTIYSDLDISIIKTMPKGRGSVKTEVIRPNDTQKAYLRIHREIEKGRQAYVIYPLVEESEKSELKAATKMYENFREKIFPHLKLGLVHGRMKPEEKNSVMHAFMKREIDILVSTTVVEVGIDQPNATVMMVEHAERFGLAQLHQLRGRVGRGGEKSYCLLAVGYRLSAIARERLKVMTQTRDGFLIAEKDLELRGTGDLFGIRQSGLPTFRVANLLRDFDLLKLAKDEAFALVAKDPELKLPENRPLRDELERSWRDRFELADIG